MRRVRVVPPDRTALLARFRALDDQRVSFQRGRHPVEMTLVVVLLGLVLGLLLLVLLVT